MPMISADAIIQSRRAALIMVTALAFLVVVGTAATLAISLGYTRPQKLIAFFDLDGESNLPTWYSSVLLLGAALLTWVAGLAARHRSDRVKWFVLAALFACLSMDETAMMHDWLGVAMGDRMQLTGVFRFGWVIPALVVLPAIAVAYWRLIWAVPNPARALMFTAAALYLGGAVGMEMVGGAWISTRPQELTVYKGLTAVEELLEIAGASCYLGLQQHPCGNLL
jgi:hypothetical protein